MCVAKLQKTIDAAAKPDGYSGLLMRQAKNSGDDQFVEVHIWGPMTVRTVESVTARKRVRPADGVNLRKLQELVEKYGGAMKVV